MHPPRPTQAQLCAAIGRKVPDLLVSNLDVLFCGINPGLYSAAVRHHFARPGNRFWPALHASGFTPRLLDPSEECELLELRLGITNIVDRATRSADELTADELQRGAKRLMKKARRFHPRFIAVLGMGAFKKAFHLSKVELGRQSESFDGSVVWVLPNPSGLNAYYQKRELVRQLRILRKAMMNQGVGNQ
jgi:double-stranded uracil-DNA glycosylase